MNICKICFRDLEEEPHQSWCPNKPKAMDMPEGFDELFKGFTINENQNDSKRNN